MVGFLLQWPTIPTLVMFPILIVIYRRLSIQEEKAVAAEVGSAWDAYAAQTPRFLPHLGSTPTTPRPIDDEAVAGRK
jgi:protein-S-isoprenylcysteine O-methyltransferase Ste14